jgi:hypothetical protein
VLPLSTEWFNPKISDVTENRFKLKTSSLTISLTEFQSLTKL